MKSKLLLASVLMFFVLKLNAQTDSLSFTERYDIYAENIDKNQIPFGVLYDRVTPHSLLNYLYASPDEIDSIFYDFNHWKQAYYELYLSTYDKYNLTTLDNINKNCFDDYYINRTINVGVLNFNYSFIDSNAIQNNLLEIIDEKLFDVNGRTESPYLIGNYIELAFLSDKIYTGVNTFKFNTNYFFTNTNLEITAIDVNFNQLDLETQRFMPGITYAVNLNNSGNRMVTYTVYFSDGSRYIGSTNVFVNNRTINPNNIRTINYHFPNTWIDYESKIKEAKVDAYYFYNSNDTLIEKPIIITDGFDPGDSRNGIDLYELMYYGPANSRKNLAVELNNKGYDVIFLNFPGQYGADFIERNAIAVEKYLTNVLNVIKIPTADKTIVIGPSMGGLVTRYALAELEKIDIDSKVSLYVSFDSPHQGANIPIGGQNFLKFFGDIANNAAALEAIAKLSTPAAKQMLLHHYENRVEIIRPNLWRDKYINNVSNNGVISSNGYPLNLRKISLINGSQTVVEQGLDNLLFKLRFVGIADVYKSPQYVTRSKVSTLFLGYLGDNNSNVLEYGNRYARAAVPNGNTIMPINGSLDNSPGGKYDLVAQICLNKDGSIKKGYTMFFPEQSFIPSVSALDIKFDNGYILNVKYNIKSKNIICNDQTPFNAYFAPTHNEAHVAISPESANWLFREIESANKTSEAGQASGYEIGSGQIFNYGANTKKYLSRSIVIKDGGILAINKNSNTGFGNEPVPISGSNYKVEAYQICNNAIGIEVRANSSFIIGDSNGNKGSFVFNEGSVFTLKSNSILKIYDNSELILPANAILNFEPGAFIQLIGDNAKLTINGKIVIKDNATFTFTGSGFISVNNAINVSMGNNTHFNLNGSGQTDKVLEINSGMMYFPFGIGATNKFTATNCNIVTTGTGRLDVASDLEIDNVKISGNLGLTTYGQYPANLLNSTFYVPITANQSGADGSPLYINNCEFNSAALMVYDKGITIDNSSFHNLSYPTPITLQSLSFTSYIRNTSIYDIGNNGIEYIGNISAPLELENVSISGAYNGVVAVNTFIKSKCSNINAFQSAFKLEAGAKLDLSTQNGGLFKNNIITQTNSEIGNALIDINEANAIYLDEGQNIIKKEFTVSKFIQGSFNNDYTSIVGENNQWFKCLNCTNAAPASTEFNIWKIGVTDFVPISTSYSADPCGIFSQSLMMVDPCLEPGGCPLSADLLDNCTECTSVKYKGQNINTKLKKIFIEIAKDSLKVHKVENFNMLDSILNFTVNGKKPKVEQLKERGYANYIKLFQDNLSDSINASSNVFLKNIYSKAINTTNQRLLKAISDMDSIKIKYYLINKAYLKLNNNEYANSISALNNALLYSKINSTEYNYIENQICLINKEEMFVNKEITSAEFDSLKLTCNANSNFTSQRGNIITNPEGIKGNGFLVKISPNPANSELLIMMEGFEDLNNNAYQIHDISGRVVKSKTKFETKNIRIDISMLDAGIYFLETSNGLFKKTNKFVVIK